MVDVFTSDWVYLWQAREAFVQNLESNRLNCSMTQCGLRISRLRDCNRKPHGSRKSLNQNDAIFEVDGQDPTGIKNGFKTLTDNGGINRVAGHL